MNKRIVKEYYKRNENNQNKIYHLINNNKTIDFNRTFTNSWRRTNMPNEISNNSFYNNPPPVPKIIN